MDGEDLAENSEPTRSSRSLKVLIPTRRCWSLWETLPECYNNDDITEYREKVYEYVFTRYKEIA